MLESGKNSATRMDGKWTPNYEHLTFRDFRKVYEPSDDTFLFMEGLFVDRDFLWTRMNDTYKDKYWIRHDGSHSVDGEAGGTDGDAGGTGGDAGGTDGHGIDRGAVEDDGGGCSGAAEDTRRGKRGENDGPMSRSCLCVEIGSGTGLVGSYLCRLLATANVVDSGSNRIKEGIVERPSELVPLLISTDVNPYAAKASRRTNQINVDGNQCGYR